MFSLRLTNSMIDAPYTLLATAFSCRVTNKFYHSVESLSIVKPDLTIILVFQISFCPSEVLRPFFLLVAKFNSF